jgi:hypothetical protein
MHLLAHKLHVRFMRSQVFTKFVFIYDLTGRKIDLASYMLSARLCERNAHVVTRRHISWICTCITSLTYVHVWIHFESKHPAHYQQYFHNVSCYCVRIYGHIIFCTQVVNRHFGWQATSLASWTTSLSSVSTLHGYGTKLPDHMASYGRQPTVNCKASQEPRQGYMIYSVSIYLALNVIM